MSVQHSENTITDVINMGGNLLIILKLALIFIVTQWYLNSRQSGLCNRTKTFVQMKKDVLVYHALHLQLINHSLTVNGTAIMLLESLRERLHRSWSFLADVGLRMNMLEESDLRFASVGKLTIRIPKSDRFYSGLRYPDFHNIHIAHHVFRICSGNLNAWHITIFLINHNTSHEPFSSLWLPKRTGNHCVSVPSPSISSSHFDSIKSPVLKLFASVAIDASQQPRDRTELMLQSRDSVTPNS